jgi:hypothetical protein
MRPQQKHIKTHWVKKELIPYIGKPMKKKL